MLVLEIGVEAANPILAEAKAFYGAPSSSVQTVHVELCKISLATGKD